MTLHYLPSGKGTQSPPGGGDGMEPRLAKVESDVGHINSDISEIRKDIRELRGEIKSVADKLDAKFILTWVGIISAALGLAYLMAKGFKWF